MAEAAYDDEMSAADIKVRAAAAAAAAAVAASIGLIVGD
jgi:hypothetical protein